MQLTDDQQIAAHQAVAEITADLGPGFTLRAMADALAQVARTESVERGENLSQAQGILRQLAEIVTEADTE